VARATRTGSRTGVLAARYRDSIGIRARHLQVVLRAFCLAAFADLASEAGAGGLPFVVAEHDSGLYEYRPLVRQHVEALASRLAKLPDARIAVGELRREPAAAIFVRARGESSADRTLFQAILLPLLTRTAEGCGGFDWEDGAFDRAYAGLERSLFGSSRSYAAVAPLLGLAVGERVELGHGFTVHPSSPADLALRWPETRGLLPPGFGEQPDRSSVLELERELPAEDAELPDAAAELARAVSALRLATGAPVAAGLVVLERLDWHPFGARPVAVRAATEPAGEPGRLDPWRGGLARELLERLAGSEDDPELAEAVAGWELALFEDEPARSERLRESLGALLGGADGLWAASMRATILLADGNRERSGLIDRFHALARGKAGGVQVADDVRRAIVECLQHDDRTRLATTLDEAMLGLRPRPAGYFSARALAS
jgi:hypothetical protein